MYSCVLNICFPYTSRDEITTAIKATVEDYSKPLDVSPRPFSQTRIQQKIRSQNIDLSANTPQRSNSPTPSESSDLAESISSATTLHSASPPVNSRNGAQFADPETITAETIAGHLFTAEDPPLDLWIRTSGVKRLSDFMLWQCHEDTELVFLDCLWPEFDLWHFLPVLLEWQWRRKHDEKSANRRIKASKAMKVW